jgi:hypothetical protein
MLVASSLGMTTRRATLRSEPDDPALPEATKGGALFAVVAFWFSTGMTVLCQKERSGSIMLRSPSADKPKFPGILGPYWKFQTHNPICHSTKLFSRI